MRRTWPDGVAAVVVDHYGLDAEFEAGLRDWADCIVVVDDVADRQHDCEILIDQNIGRKASDYHGRVSAECQLLIGPTYALLRPVFAELRPEALERRRLNDGKVDRILLALGMTDPVDATTVALKAVDLVDKDMGVDVVLGPSAPFLDRVRTAVARSSKCVQLYADGRELATLMVMADLAIGATGMMSWERCCLGLPALTTVIADNQRGGAEGLSAAGATVDLGASTELDPQVVAGQLSELIDDNERVLSMSAAAQAICDGLGATRVADCMMSRIA